MPACRAVSRATAKLAAATAALAICIGPSAAIAQVSIPGSGGTVYESLAYGAPLPDAIPTTGVPAEVQQAWRRFTSRARRFTTRVPESDVSELREVWGERIGIERVVFSLFETPDIAREAEVFVQALPFYYEAEGDIGRVLTVPDAADAYVQAHPRSVLRDYALFLAGHRRACGIKDSELSNTPEGARQRQHARQDLLRAERSPHPLIRFAASLELNQGCAH